MRGCMDVLTWKSTFWVNIYEMADDKFLFEFPTKYMVKHVLQKGMELEKRKIPLE